MLQLFKKAGPKDKPKSLPIISFSNSKEPQVNGLAGSTVSTGGPSLLCSFEEEEEDDSEEVNISSLCMCPTDLLPRVLADKSALGYFIQFMETRGDGAIIKFYLDVECFFSAYKDKDFAEKINLPDNKCSDNIVDLCACNKVSKSVSDPEIDNISIDSCSNKFEQTSSVLSNDLPKSKRCKYGFNKCIEQTFLQDALRIYHKYLANDVLGPNCMPEDLKNGLQEAVKSGDYQYVIKYLNDAQKIILNVLEQNINDFSRSNFYFKHQIDILTSGNVTLSDILFNEGIFFYFMEFIEVENKKELLDFWVSATNYKQTFLEKDGLTDSPEAQADALVIYEKYFSLQATTPLGFSDKIRYQVEQNICREDGKPPQPDCFDQACQVVYHFLSKYYLPLFLQSQLFYKYLTEMINSVQNSIDSVYPVLRRTESDCTSEISTISSKSSPTRSSRDLKKFKASSASKSMSIDTRNLYDPDSLWKRNRTSLSVGYIDNLGRFITEIERDPSRKSGKESRLSQAVKKLVHMEQDEAKEESAWKIAEMIVRDVTSLTMGTPELSS